MFNGSKLLTNLGIENHTDIADAIELQAPSMAQYFIQESLGKVAASPRSNYIQQITTTDNYKIYVDYNDEITIEVLNNEDVLTSCMF